MILKGDVTKKTTIKVQSASKSAVKAVEKAGGKVEIIERQKRQKQEKTTK